eukprot:TRINITY_DN894_c0_g1_i4.p3 TRINITY_DN894_c0_g1~~TRINITY_DN894_c0_g1_i4.p3  ORF type:complete len:148 (+),score=21.18 TRINITY_DN894_c0_g1_i4:1-444(+)
MQRTFTQRCVKAVGASLRGTAAFWVTRRRTEVDIFEKNGCSRCKIVHTGQDFSENSSSRILTADCGSVRVKGVVDVLPKLLNTAENIVEQSVCGEPLQQIPYYEVQKQILTSIEADLSTFDLHGSLDKEFGAGIWINLEDGRSLEFI